MASKKDNALIYLGIGAIILYFLLKKKNIKPGSIVEVQGAHVGPQFIRTDNGGLSKSLVSVDDPNLHSDAVIDPNAYYYEDISESKNKK
jgi:hypothetical protein